MCKRCTFDPGSRPGQGFVTRIESTPDHLIIDDRSPVGGIVLILAPVLEGGMDAGTHLFPGGHGDRAGAERAADAVNNLLENPPRAGA